MTVSILAVHQGGGVGGAPVSLLKLLSKLDRDQFRASAVFTESGDLLGFARELEVPSQVVPSGGAFFYSAHARLEPRSVSRFLRTFPAAVQLARQTLRRERPDVLHLNTSVLLAWAAAARRERQSVLWMVREVLGPNPLVRAWQARFVASHARRVVAISDAVRACFPCPERVARVHNAVDLDEFKLASPEESRAARAELHLPNDRQLLMVLGSVQRVKGHWLLLHALKQLPATVDLVLVTGGVDATAYAATTRGRIKSALGMPFDNLAAFRRDAARLGLSSRVHVTGFRRDIARALSAADVVAFPSLAPEGFGRPIIEAMAMARPVVATDIGPSAELLGPDAGRLVDPNASSMAAAIDDLLRAPAERSRLGMAGRRRVETSFGLDQQVSLMSRLYREAAGIA